MLHRSNKFEHLLPLFCGWYPFLCYTGKIFLSFWRWILNRILHKKYSSRCKATVVAFACIVFWICSCAFLSVKQVEMLHYFFLFYSLDWAIHHSHGQFTCNVCTGTLRESVDKYCHFVGGKVIWLMFINSFSCGSWKGCDRTLKLCNGNLAVWCYKCIMTD